MKYPEGHQSDGQHCKPDSRLPSRKRFLERDDPDDGTQCDEGTVYRDDDADRAELEGGRVRDQRNYHL